MKYSVSILFEVTADSHNDAVETAVAELIRVLSNPEESPALLVNVVENTGGVH